MKALYRRSAWLFVNGLAVVALGGLLDQVLPRPDYSASGGAEGIDWGFIGATVMFGGGAIVVAGVLAFVVAFAQQAKTVAERQPPV